MPMNIGTWNTCRHTWRSSWIVITMAGDYTRRSVTSPRKRLKRRRPFRGRSREQRRLSFLRHRRSTDPMCQYEKCVGAGAALQSPLLPHRLDESPTDYSSASCSPAELASASSDELIVQPWPPFVQQKNTERSTLR